MKTAKIHSVTKLKDEWWENGSKWIRKSQVFMDNGDQGIVGTFEDEEEPVNGEDLTYEVKKTRYGNELVRDRRGPISSTVEDIAKGFSPKTYKQHAMLNTIAICKSALEGGAFEWADIKMNIAEMYDFFLVHDEGNEIYNNSKKQENE